MSIGRVPGATGIQPSIVDAKGDLIVATAADSVSRLAAGSNNQVLTADSATATGLKWAAPDPLTTKGDLFTFSTTEDRLAVGANDTVLTADSSTATGLKWVAPAGGGANWSLLNAGGTSLTGAATITVSGISGADKIMVIINSASSANSQSSISVRVNGETGTIYHRWGPEIVVGATYAASNFNALSANDTSVIIATMASNAGSVVRGGITLTGCNSSGVKQFTSTGGSTSAGASGQYFYTLQGYINTSSTISSVSVVSSTGDLDAGTVFVYTSA